MNKMLLIESNQRRDADLIERFCTKETLMGDGGQPVRVCRTVSFEELLNVLHLHDQELLAAQENDETN